jgi:hypothetical protein
METKADRTRKSMEKQKPPSARPRPGETPGARVIDPLMGTTPRAQKLRDSRSRAVAVTTSQTTAEFEGERAAPPGSTRGAASREKLRLGRSTLENRSQERHVNLSEPKEEALTPKPPRAGPGWWIAIAVLAAAVVAMVVHNGYALKAHGTTWGVELTPPAKQ